MNLFLSVIGIATVVSGIIYNRQTKKEKKKEIEIRREKSAFFNTLFLNSILENNKIVKNQNCICMMCIKPSQIWIDFLLEIKKKDDYDIFILVDDNSQQYHIDGLHVIQLGDQICKECGFFNSNFCVKKGEPSCWDKMFFYFSYHNNYQNYWIIEEDVFIPTVETIRRIDKKYSSKKNTVLIRSNEIKESDAVLDWHWKHMKFRKTYPFKLPWFKSMVCALRLPNCFFRECKQFVLDKKRLFFIEFFINTLAEKRKIKIETIDELSEIHFRKKYTLDDFQNKNKMYHDVKDVKLHQIIRNLY